MKNTAVICLSSVNGGMELASVKLAKILSSNVEITFISKKGSFIELNRKDNFLDFPIDLHTINFNNYFSFLLMLHIRKIINEKNIKNIIFLGASEMRSLYFACLGIDLNFIIRQGSKKTSSKKDFLHALLYSNVNTFVGNCEYMKNNIQQILPIPKYASLTRIYSSLQLPELISTKQADNCIDIVIVGRIHPGKGQLDAIEACEVLYQNNIAFKLTLLGDIQHKEYYQQIQEYLSSSKFRNSVNIVGYTNEVKAYLQKSDMFIFPSHGEGMSNAIIEALGFGLITLIYNDTSSPEFKDLGFNLHLTTDNNIPCLKTNLLAITKNLKKEKEKAEENIPLAKKVFSPNREKKEYMDLLL